MASVSSAQQLLFWRSSTPLLGNTDVIVNHFHSSSQRSAQLLIGFGSIQPIYNNLLGFCCCCLKFQSCLPYGEYHLYIKATCCFTFGNRQSLHSESFLTICSPLKPRANADSCSCDSGVIKQRCPVQRPCAWLSEHQHSRKQLLRLQHKLLHLHRRRAGVCPATLAPAVLWCEWKKGIW